MLGWLMKVKLKKKFGRITLASFEVLCLYLPSVSEKNHENMSEN
jgi:hypothetical protein